MDLQLLVPYTPYVLILGGVMVASWLIGKLSKPVLGAPVSAAVKVMSLFGFLVGVLVLVTAVGVWLSQSWDSGTRYLLVVTGLALVLKPLKDIPWAALIKPSSNNFFINLDVCSLLLPNVIWMSRDVIDLFVINPKTKSTVL